MGGGGTVHGAGGTVEASLLLISLCGTQIIRRIKYSDGLCGGFSQTTNSLTVIFVYFGRSRERRREKGWD